MSSDLPYHIVVGMPALSPTMESGTIAEWNVKEGDAFAAGDSVAEIETDKATIAFEVSDEVDRPGKREVVHECLAGLSLNWMGIVLCSFAFVRMICVSSNNSSLLLPLCGCALDRMIWFRRLFGMKGSR